MPSKVVGAGGFLSGVHPVELLRVADPGSLAAEAG